jgi:hypothetical protein
MALANQGFEKRLNLFESVDDRAILNNLGGGGIADDISLFRNNLRNTSSLTWQHNTDNSTITTNRFIFPTTVDFIYTNGDRVTVKGSSLGSLNATITYFIVDFAIGLGAALNQAGFGLSLTKGGSRVALGSITANVEFVREDIVTKDNVLNIGIPESQENGTVSGSPFSYDLNTPFTDAFNVVESNIDFSDFLRKSKYISNQSIATDKKITIEGGILSTDPGATNISNTALAQQNSPGTYISNPFSPTSAITKTRAYSSSSQPWIEETGKLTTKSAEVNIGDLYFTNGITITDFDGVANVSGNVSTFTHKLPVLINGVEYFVLLRS